MGLVSWFKTKRAEMDFIYDRAVELRTRYGGAAEQWVETHLLASSENLERRTLRQLKKSLKHVR